MKIILSFLGLVVVATFTVQIHIQSEQDQLITIGPNTEVENTIEKETVTVTVVLDSLEIL